MAPSFTSLSPIPSTLALVSSVDASIFTLFTLFSTSILYSRVSLLKSILAPSTERLFRLLFVEYFLGATAVWEPTLMVTEALFRPIQLSDDILVILVPLVEQVMVPVAVGLTARL